MSTGCYNVRVSAASTIPVGAAREAEARPVARLGLFDTKELRPGTRIVSHQHDMGDWPPVRRVDVTVDGRVHPVYLWIVGR